MKKENQKLSPLNQDISINLSKNNDNNTNYLSNDILFSTANLLSRESLLNPLVSSSSVPSTSSPLFSPTSNNCSTFNYNGGNILARNSTKTLKCPKCNWHYKYQETLEIHMKEKHSDQEVLCLFCLENQTHPKLARGETYSCGYKPYRCELCKYSTTTKGNLSIHMQSDKHLHALQEIPQSLAAAAVAAAAGSSQLIIGNNQFNNYSTQELDISTNSTTNNSKIIGGALQCLICFNFYTDISELMVEHLEKDRSQTQECDISTINGYFQCLICPYSTNLKANFQLHTRTDKHLQRIQMINHLREGISGLFGQSEQFARLGTLKSAVQVRCQECEEILSCIPTLREHCQSNSHQIRMISNGRCLQNQSPFEKENILEYFLNNSLIFCGICDWEGNGKEIVSLAFEHANTHFEKSNEYSKKNDISINQTDTNKEEKINDIKNNKNNKINDNIEEEDNLIGWKQLDKYLIDAGLAKYMKSEENIEENNKNNNVDTLANQIISLQTLAKCSFCPADSTMSNLPKHISEEHNIPFDIAQQLSKQIVEGNQQKISTNNNQIEDSINYSASTSSMTTNPTSSLPSNQFPSNKEDENNIPSTSSFNYLSKQSEEEKNIFCYKCNQCSNNIAFRTEDQLKAHSLCHSPARFKLKRKIGNEKQKIFNKCDICQEGFDTNEELLEHFNSEKHLQKVAEQTLGAEDGNRSRLNSNQFSSICSTSRTPSKSSTSKQYSNSRRNSTNSNKYLPYICNICSLSFGQPGTLDTHLRSTAHAQRIVKLNELVKSGELNPQLPVFEQPEPHPPQRSIGELLREKKKQQKMGKLTAIQTPQQPSIPSTSTTTSEQNNDILDWWKNSSEQQQQTNNSMINLMSQIFNDSQQKQQNDVDSFCTAQMAQIAQMMLSAQMTAAAQMASLNSENGRNGLLDLLGIKNEEETIINNKQSELDNNQELNKSVSPFEEPQAKKSKTERKLSEKSGNNEIKKNSQLNDNSDQNGGFNQNNSYGDFASVLRALTSSSASFGEQSTTSLDPSDPLSSQFPSNQITSTDDPTAFLMATMAAAAAQNGGNNTQTNNNNQQTNSGNQSPSAQQKRARTRIGDDHVKILRQYFDINNSPSEEQIKEMAQRTNLAEKVIKHWFRNTLFKERQRDKDSPYNFSIPPQMSIDLATYHKTGEAKIVPLIKQEKEENESMGEEERNDEENSKIIENYQNEMKDYSDQELDEQEMSEDNKEGKGEEEEEENIILEQKQEEQKILKKKNKKTKSVALGEETKINSNEQFKSIETVAADLLASIGRQQMQNNLINSLGDEGRINEGIEFSQDTQQLLSSPLLNGTSLNFDTAGQFAQMMFSSAAAAAAAAAGIPSSFSSFNLFNPFVSTASTSIDLNNILQQPTTTQEIDIINPFINSSTQQTTTSSSIPSCSSSTSINSINQIIQQQSTNNSNTTNIVMPGGGSSGRRANRTRFTDFQLRTMQEFFDKQAYPKDDDLEMLSKKLGLSPRVIVVWFQNARQKARKVFEQQPHLLSHPSIIEQVTEGRFARTPSANFQCRVCGQVFQRYLELIQHQQRICCLSSSVKSEEQNNENIGDFNVSDFLNGKITKNENKEENGIDEENKHLLNTSIENTSQEMILFNQLLAAAGCSQINQMKIEAPPTNDSNNEVSTPSVSSLGQCPLCGLQFNCNDKLAKHISENHFSSSTTPFNLKLFSDKNLEENKQQNPLDLTVNNNGYKTEEDEELEGEDERRYFLSNDPSLSPTEGNEGLLNESSLAAALSLFGGQKQINEGINQRQRPQSQSNSGSFGNNSSKRFRTHLTPMQVFVMKSLFHDYKTPSMQECDSLGRRIGLTKRVVQVWFQNTRAKERKTGSSSGSAEPEELIPCCGSSIHCQLCDIPIGNNINNNNCQLLQEHIFTEKHLEKVKEKCSQLKTTIRGCSVSIGGDEQQNSSFLDEKREEGDDEEEKINENFDWNNEEEGEKKLNERNQSSSLSPGQSLNAAAAQLPYYALAAAAAAGGMPINGLLPPLLYDPLLFGTPISALKVPESVAQQIITDMSCGKGQSRFTQDGLEINKLEVKLTENFGILSSVDLEVGWGCQNCNNVFQQPELLQNHWKLICPAGEDVGAFKLIQTHYQCNPCQKKFGTQDDFCDHYLSAEHKTNCKAPLKKEGK